MPCPQAPLPGCTWHSPGIGLTVVLPGHDVFKQLPAGDAAGTGRVTTHRGPRGHVSWKSLQEAKSGAQGPQNLRPKGRGPRSHRGAPHYNPLPDFQPTLPLTSLPSTLGESQAEVRTGGGTLRTRHYDLLGSWKPNDWSFFVF